MRHCTSCGTEVPDDARFCRHCGETLSVPAPMLDTKATDVGNTPLADEQEFDDLAAISTVPLADGEGQGWGQAGVVVGDTVSSVDEQLAGRNVARAQKTSHVSDVPTSRLPYPSLMEENVKVVAPLSTGDKPHVVAPLPMGDGPQAVVPPFGSSVVSQQAPSLGSPSSLPGLPLQPQPQRQPRYTPVRRGGRGSPIRWLIIAITCLLILAGGVSALVAVLHPFAPGTGGTPIVVTKPTPTASVCPKSVSTTDCLATRISAVPVPGKGSKVGLTFSGAVVGQMTAPTVVSCGVSQSAAGGQQYQVAVFGKVGSQQYAFTVGVYPYLRPNMYTTAVFSFFGPAGDNSSIAKWRASPSLGMNVTVNSDEKSGTLDIGYMSSDDNSTAHVVGSWTCA